MGSCVAVSSLVGVVGYMIDRPYPSTQIRTTRSLRSKNTISGLFVFINLPNNCILFFKYVIVFTPFLLVENFHVVF